jgi:hypothetical protein
MRGSTPGAIVAATLIATIAGGALAKGSSANRELTAAQIVAKNEAVRGGRDAWRRIQTMVWVGRMESVNTPTPSMPFVLQQQRPNKTRFELSTLNQRTVNVFDGAQGWKMRPGRGGSPDVKPFSAQELKFAQAAQTIDGPLIDSAAKGNAVELQGVEQVEGRKTYRLSVRLASGEREAVWIDAQTFLDVRFDRLSFSSAGMPGMASIFYRNYRTIDGLQIPMTLEIGVGSGRTPDKMLIERVSLNPPLDEQTFEKPGAPHHRQAAAVGAAPAMPQPAAMPTAPSSAAVPSSAPEVANSESDSEP